MSRAAARRPDRVTLGRLAYVNALLRSPDGTATIDAATSPDELATGFSDGGQWRGTITRSLVAAGLAEIAGATRSIRPSRHRGWVAVLRLTDRTKAAEYVRRLSAAFTATNETTPPVAADGVAMTDTNETTTKEI
jgi:hypothetical protein